MFFPGTYQHRVKDVRVELVGLVPPEGARGILTAPGVWWVRVPNQQAFLVGQTKPDWATDSLATSAAFPQSDEYLLKRVTSHLVTLSLSQFDVRADRAVLSSPQGMLKPVEHQGLDAAWTLTLHRQANNFDFADIIDAELTFWFLCDYDPALEQAQENALTVEGRQGKLVAAAKTAFAIHQPDTWAAFVNDTADPEALDLRYLTVDVGALPLWEQARKFADLLLGFARLPAEAGEMRLRLCCEHDPVGSCSPPRTARSSRRSAWTCRPSTLPPTPDPAFDAWVRKTFYFTLPDVDLPFRPGDPLPERPDPPAAPPRRGGPGSSRSRTLPSDGSSRRRPPTSAAGGWRKARTGAPCARPRAPSRVGREARRRTGTASPGRTTASG